ncbi:hypothetical protein [Stieleria varia]|uniref:Uncharacterized protein n=1 Tax=Stieleria varia TaxID=2528005 RepID=A0A5C6AY79_9BACT|nr:hypothetical protein [Stieleria varia]TWU04437.1 hypothetical protein Pla52n_24780 [Stieleria varia]
MMSRLPFWPIRRGAPAIAPMMVLIGSLVACPMATVSAQVMLSPSLQADTDAKADEPQEKAPQTIVLHPCQQPDPLLRYRLWPSPEDRQPRLATPIVSRAAILSVQVGENQKVEFSKDYGEWLDMPVDQLPVDAVRKVLIPYEKPLGELRRIENMMDVSYDLGMDRMTAGEIFQTWLPEFQEMRSLARALALRIRLATAEKRWDDAIDDLRLGFRLAEVGSRSTDLLIGRLVGIAITGVMINEIEQIQQQPDAPSLYWALSMIPVDRISNISQSLEFESGTIAHVGMLSELRRLPKDPIGEPAAIAWLQSIGEQFRLVSESDVPAESTALLSGLYAATMIEPARMALSNSSLWRDRMEGLSDAEIVLRAIDLEMRRVRDRWLVWSTLPDVDRQEYTAERNAAFELDEADLSVGQVLARLLLPAADAVFRARTRCKQDHSLAMTFAALRLHAGQTGQLPEKLSQLRPVPARRDDFTGEHFSYKRTSPNQATLTRAARSPNDPDTVLEIKLEASR